MGNLGQRKALVIWAGGSLLAGMVAGGLLTAKLFSPASSPPLLPIPDLLKEAHSLLDKGQDAEAEKGYLAILARDPGNPEALTHLGNIAFARGDVERALLNYDEALRRDQAYAHALWDKGIALRAKGDDAGAVVAWEAFAGLFPADSPDVVRAKEWIAEARARVGSMSAVSPGPVPLSPLLFTGQAARAYQVAREIPDILQQLRCYCGCDKPPFNHTSLLSCYLDNHAAT